MEETFKDIPVVHAKTSKDWNKWLFKHHQSSTSAWLILAHKTSQIKTITHDEAVEEALKYAAQAVKNEVLLDVKVSG